MTSAPIVGSLGAANNLSEIATAGPLAQQAACANIGAISASGFVSTLFPLGEVSGTLAVDVTTNRNQSMTLSGNVDDFSIGITGAAPTNSYYQGVLWVTQGTGGTFTIAWPSNVRWAGAFAPALSTAQGSVDAIQYTSIDGGVSWIFAMAQQVPPFSS